MAKYRSKPKEIEAEQWFPDKSIEGVFTEDDSKADTNNPWPVNADLLQPVRYFVVTIHQQRVYLEPGDYIITEPDGKHHYPCKPDVFQNNYELI